MLFDSMTSTRRYSLWNDKVRFTILVTKNKNKKSAYKTWFSDLFSADDFSPHDRELYVPSRVALYWHGLNIGNGYKAKLVREYNGKKSIFARKS